MNNQSLDQPPQSIEPRVQKIALLNKGITIISRIVIFALFVLVIYLLITKLDNDPKTINNKDEQYQQVEQENNVVVWKTYKNEKFGFELKLTDAWEGYKVKLVEMSSNFGAGTLVFQVPTNKIIPNLDGYADVVKITIYNHDYWNELQKDQGPKPEFLGKNNNYVFAYSPWQDPPKALLNMNFEINMVMKTFKFTN